MTAQFLYTKTVLSWSTLKVVHTTHTGRTYGPYLLVVCTGLKTRQAQSYECPVRGRGHL